MSDVAGIVLHNVLKNPETSIQSKLSMKLFAICSLLFLDKKAEAFSELGDFIRYYKSIPEDYERTWVYAGTKNFITKSGIVGQVEKDLMLRLIDILESQKLLAEDKIMNFEKRLPDIFDRLKKD